MATRPVLTPGWLNRTSMPLARVARAPMAVASLRPLGPPTGLRNWRLFAGTRPLVISRLASFADLAVGHWSRPLALVRPWHQTARMDPWFGHAAHFDFRARRHPRDAGAQYDARRAAVQRAEVGSPVADAEWWPESRAESAWDVEAEIFDSLSAEPMPSLTPVADEFVPLAIPQEPAKEQFGPQIASHSPMARKILARGRAVEQRALDANIIQNTTSATQEATRPVRRAMSETPVAEPSVGRAASLTPQPPLAAPGVVEPVTSNADAEIPQVRLLSEARPSRLPPAWPFKFVTRAMAAASAVARSAQIAGSALAASAPLIVRHIARASTPQAGGRAPHRSALTERPRTIADDMTAARPVSAMIAKVPPAELLLEGEQAPAASTGETHVPAVPAERVVRARRSGEAMQIQDEDARAGAASPDAEMASETKRQPEVLSQLARDWPVLAAVQRLAAPLVRSAAASESAAMQVLRRLSPARRREALAGVAALPALGSGEALPAEVRRPMETLLGRDLGGVRTFTAQAAASLGAEAFTTGERIVFAPGRFDTRTTRGLSLLGHELAHVGQPLAFREEGAQTATDAAEEAARQQEAHVTRIIEQGWPQAPRMEVLDAARALGRLAGQSAAQVASSQSQAAAGAASVAQGAGSVASGAQGTGSTASAAPQGESGAGAPAGDAASGGAAAGSSGAAGGAPGGGPAAPNIDKLAQDVYALLKARLRAEQMRHQLY